MASGDFFMTENEINNINKVAGDDSVNGASDIVIDVKDVTKIYRLYDQPIDRLKEAISVTHKNYHRDFYALNHINFQVGKGESVGIIGTNGSGKSTILKIITGVLTPSGGTVNINGIVCALLELGAGFNPDYTGIENVYMNGTMMGFTREQMDEKLQEILDFADIGDFVNQPVKSYSSGMFVRLAFAVSINIDPEILIVDEALSVGDVFFQAKCYHKFEEFKKRGKTILFVSHDLSSISKYCDRAVLLNQGVLLGEGTPKKMIDIYKQVLVGQYPLPTGEGENLLDDDQIRQAAADADKKADDKIKKDDSAKKTAAENPDTLEYGDGAATITNYFVTDNTGKETNSIIKGTDFTVHMRVKFNRDIAAPIFALTFKNIMGIEITGTNSMVEKAFLEPVKAGEEKDVTFTQNMSLQGGEYLLSFGVTGFEQNDFTVYHRLYDALNVSVVSDKNTVGYYDMNSKCVVTDVK